MINFQVGVFIGMLCVEALQAIFQLEELTTFLAEVNAEIYTINKRYEERFLLHFLKLEGCILLLSEQLLVFSIALRLIYQVGACLPYEAR